MVSHKHDEHIPKSRSPKHSAARERRKLGLVGEDITALAPCGGGRASSSSSAGTPDALYGIGQPRLPAIALVNTVTRYGRTEGALTELRQLLDLRYKAAVDRHACAECFWRREVSITCVEKMCATTTYQGRFALRRYGRMRRSHGVRRPSCRHATASLANGMHSRDKRVESEVPMAHRS